MVKPRPVMVVSPQLPYRGDIVSMVPISLTAPRHNLPFCVKLSKNYHPKEREDLACWAKCDMLMNLGRWRLDGFKVGRRKFHNPKASAEDLQAVKEGILYGLGQGHLISNN